MKTLTELSLATGFWISRTIQWADDAALIYAVQDQGQAKLFRQSINGQPPLLLTSVSAGDEF